MNRIGGHPGEKQLHLHRLNEFWIAAYVAFPTFEARNEGSHALVYRTDADAQPSALQYRRNVPEIGMRTLQFEKRIYEVKASRLEGGMKQPDWAAVLVNQSVTDDAVQRRQSSTRPHAHDGFFRLPGHIKAGARRTMKTDCGVSGSAAKKPSAHFAVWNLPNVKLNFGFARETRDRIASREPVISQQAEKLAGTIFRGTFRLQSNPHDRFAQRFQECDACRCSLRVVRRR